MTLDTGTGVVHTAPGHGWDDYLTGVKYGLEIYCPVDEAGRFLPEVEHFAGQKVFDANPKVIDFLREKGALLGSGKETHSYPICWRCKNPIIFRATEQWFIGLDSGGFRERALEAIAKVRWYPAWGEERIRNMIAARPDWCISRQRLWGVPIPAFYCKGCATALLTPEMARRVADLFEEEQRRRLVRAREAAELLPAGLRLPEVRRARSSTRRRTSSTSGSTPAPRTRPCSRSGPGCAGRPTSTSRAATSTAAGSTRRC